MPFAQWSRQLFGKTCGFLAGENRAAKMRAAPSTSASRRRSFITPQFESLEDRLAPAGNLALTSALLVDFSGHAITAPNKGEQVFIRANWNTQDLPSNASYRIAYTVD